MHTSSIVNNIRKEIEENRYIASNIWNVNKQDTSKILHTFYVELKPENNNKDIEIRSLFQCKIKFE
jgi:hypothetical protein